ncbi:putative Vacuolar protein sorting-associated protein 13 [Sclerotinia borealis F-4128]|uniref:Vacuolar protein sorting-associated protein n=1 Tax=Sclerotinia borealis (strain F-4128) TaxID=1432307 RepID=W9CRU7_SCLBF|nr:putative Vacuolar protein sorting-associated protein 13 [Sclerotinia borealis F-4128]
MLEGLVASLLNRFLGMYIRNFDPGQLKVGIWSGDVKLRDLELRREALDQLKLPINVVEGHLGQLTLKIPWSNLRGQPVQVEIEDIYVLASPKEDAEWDEEEEERRRQAVKIEKLDSAEMLKDRNQEGLSLEEQQKNQSFTDSLVTKIIDNLQITVKNIHVRYEDSISAPGHPFALGLTLQEFSAISTDGKWKPTYIQNSSGTTHKLATLGALAVYWNTDTDLLSTGREAEVPGSTEVTSHDEMLIKFKEMIVRGEDAKQANHQFILKPVSGQMKLEIDKSGKIEIPHMKAGLLFDEIGVVLDDNQYRDALMMVDLFHYFLLHQEYKKFQPKGVRPKEDPRAWLKFAGNAILSKIHERNRRWSWAYFKERRDDRIRYIELFKKKKKQVEPLSADETDELDKLEWKLDYEDMRFWRSLARNQLKKENVGIKKAAPKQKQGWVAWAWGAKPQEEQEDEETTMTEEQRKELYDAIDWDEKTVIAESVDLPKETIKLQIEASLNTGSFTLKRDPHDNTVEVLSLYFDGFKAKFLQRPESMLADVSLGGLRVNDGTTPDSLFPQIVRVKDAPETPKAKLLLNGDEEESGDIPDPFFQFQVETNPLKDDGDVVVTGKLKPLEIIWNPHFLVGIIQFFKPPERHMESIGALMESAGATVEGLRQQTRAGLEFALEEHKTINAKLDLQAPLIIVPENITSRKTTCLILDAGHISVNSELVDEETMREVQSKQKTIFTDADYKRLESLMYDRFVVKLSNTQVLIGPSIEDTKAQVMAKDDPQSMRVVEKINIDFIVETSIIPKAPNLTKVRVSGRLPVLHASASDKKYKSLMSIINAAIPNLDAEELPAQTLAKSRPPSTLSILAPSSSKQQRDRARSASFNFSKQEAIILEDESSDDDDDEDDFQDAPSGKESDKLKLEQKNFELKFEVERLQGSLYRSDPEGRKPDQLLVEVVAENFGVNLVLRPYDLIVETFLQSVVMDDYVDNPPAEFKSIVSSGDMESEDETALINVKVVKVNPTSPEFMPKYDGVEINVDISVSTINLVVTRKTLLTLLDFILITFTDQDSPQKSPQAIKETKIDLLAAPNESPFEEEVVPPPRKTELSVRVKVDLKSIRLILNNDGIRLATLSFNHADVGIFILGNTMRIGAKLGDLSLVDDVNLGATNDSNLRKLIAIEGDDLADFRYETFDAESGSYPGYDSSIYLRAGSIKVNFLEEPYRKIIEFLVKFGKMQALFNAARQAAANRASQLQQSTSRIKFDVNIKTPIVVFPRVMNAGSGQRDLLTAYLGEIYAENKFVPLDDSKDATIAMKLTAGIRNIRLTSDFHFPDEKAEELELIDKVDLGFLVTYAEHTSGALRPDLEIEGHMSDFNLRITQMQVKFLLELAKSVPGAFMVDSDDSKQQAIEDVPNETTKKAKAITQKSSGDDSNNELIDLGPELGSNSQSWTKLDLAFHVNTIGLELVLAKENEPVGDLEAASLSKFSMDDTKVKLRMMTDGSLESEFLIHAFTIQDSRKRETNKFRKIMSSSNKDVQQFMASITISGGQERNLIAILSIDSPKVIFALDYLFALQAFITDSLEAEEPISPDDDDNATESENVSDADSMQVVRPKTVASQARSSSKTPSQSSSSSDQPATTIAFRVNVVDAQIILIANPLSTSSEAIVLGTKQILMSKQHALTLQVSEMGMFLCRMDKFEDTRLRILDDFSLQMSLDSSKPNAQSIYLDVEPLVLRLSLRDILLAIQIFQRASELSGNDDEHVDNKPAASDVKARQLHSSSSLKQRTASGKGGSTMRKTNSGTVAPSQKAPALQADTQPVPKKHEELTATLAGMRLILIGDLHELPILDLSVKKFTTSATDWTSNLRADTAINMFINVYNFSKSAWEPLIEPWELGLLIAKDSNPECMSVDLISKKMLEITVTSATIALASKSAQFLTQSDDVLSKPRGADAPYRIRNYTGFDINVWADVPDADNTMAATLEDGEEAPWRFEDWEKMRENLSPENTSGFVGLRLEGSGFDSLNKIPVNREGETLYSLRPRKDKILHRLLVEVTLGTDNVKYITFRSPLLVENKTQIPVELGVFDSQEGHLLKIEKIAPGESRPAPVGAAYMKSLLVRPDQGFGYSWSTESLFWKDLLKNPTRTITCKGESGDKTPPFYFQMNATFDKTTPITSIYPYMRIRLSAPIELENLLPYDFKYRIYDKNTKKDWTNFLRKGGLSPVHVVELSHLLLMSIDMQDTVFKASEFAIINSNNQDDFRKETALVCKDRDGLSLNLRLHYYKIPDSGGAFRVTVYSPYVILNKTGLEINIKQKSLLQQAKTAAGQGFHTDAADSERRKALPYMFAYGGDDQRNRALLKIGDSNWSKPQSLDAIGSNVDVVLPSSKDNTEIHVGINIEAGDGKYKMTKVVTLAPRFVLKNQMSEEINVREPVSSELWTLKPQALEPLHFLQKSPVKQLTLCFPGLNNQWSSPFTISNLGITHVKLAKAGQRQKLIRIEVLMENATIFLHISAETKNWPFSMRNESDTEFMFFQANPNLDDDDAEDRSGWRPIRYRLPPRSIMPYAWDYPAAKQKELIINANGRERHIKLAEIGNLIPMKIGGDDPNLRNQKIIDLNVAADGPTQTLILSNYKASKSLYKQKSRTNSSVGVAGGFEVKSQDTAVNFKAQLKLGGIGISLVNAQLKELAYITLRDIALKYAESPLYQTVTASIKWIQIDNQLYGGIFPMILYPSVVQKGTKETEAHPSLHAMVTRVKDDSYGVIYIKYATILVQQMTLEIDEDFVWAVLEFSKVPGASWSETHEGVLCDESLDIPEPKQEQSGQDIYFELLNIQPMQLDLSFVRTDRVNVEDKTSSKNPLMFFLNVLTMAIGNINDAPVRMNALMLENARVSAAVLMMNISNHYSQEALYQVHKILGSADFLGNPVGLFTNISSGVADIFYEPYQGFIMNDPEQLGIGIAKGATSFVKKSVFGVSDSFSKWTGSIAKGLAEATMDKQFQDRRRMTRSRNRPKHALYGVTAGANSFVTSLASGVGGLARKPLEGAEKEGVAGFFKGVGKGVLGFATKPAIGVFDLASNVSEGIRNTTTVFDDSGLDRVRLTRYIGADGIVRPYSQREALGQFWLKQLDNGKYFNEQYIAHLELPREDVVVMLTYSRIMLIKSKKLTSEWDVPLKDIQTISKERTGLSLTLRGGTNGPFVPVAEESSRNFLYKNIGVAVGEFNKKYKATE